MTNTGEIVTKAHSVALNIHIAQFSDVLIDHTLMVGQIVEFHIIYK